MCIRDRFYPVSITEEEEILRICMQEKIDGIVSNASDKTSELVAFIGAQMFVREANRIASKEYEEEIYAVNFFKKVDEIKESMALETDLRTWANASAWSLEDDSAVEITEVEYDFNAETIEPGDYKVTFKT